MRCQESSSTLKREAGLVWKFPAPSTSPERTALPASARGSQEGLTMEGLWVEPQINMITVNQPCSPPLV